MHSGFPGDERTTQQDAMRKLVYETYLHYTVHKVTEEIHMVVYFLICTFRKSRYPVHVVRVSFRPLI